MPDLVLLDLRLPGDDGFVVMEQFRASAELSVIPVIVITILNSARDRALEAGAVAFFQKPADNAELLAAIRRTLGEVHVSIILNTQIAS